jgi:hypothetical protein
MGIAGIGVGIAIASPNRRSRHARGGAGQGVLEKVPTSALRGPHLPDLENLRGLVGMLPASDFRDPVIVFLVSHDFFWSPRHNIESLDLLRARRSPRTRVVCSDPSRGKVSVQHEQR